MRLEPRDWDSAFFGYPVAAAEPDHGSASAAEVVAALKEALELYFEDRTPSATPWAESSPAGKREIRRGQ